METNSGKENNSKSTNKINRPIDMAIIPPNRESTQPIDSVSKAVASRLPKTLKRVKNNKQSKTYVINESQKIGIEI